MATATYDLATDVGKVRLLIPDTDLTAPLPLFKDAELEAFIALEGDSPHRAAAQALDTIASNTAMVLKVIEVLDLKTDGAKVSAELRARAKALRDRADEVDALDDDGTGFAVAEYALPVFGDRERLWNELYRQDA